MSTVTGTPAPESLNGLAVTVTDSSWQQSAHGLAVTCSECGAIEPDTLHRSVSYAHIPVWDGRPTHDPVVCDKCCAHTHDRYDKFYECWHCTRRVWYHGIETWPRRYCSEVCRQSARRDRDRRSPRHKTCETCGELFTPPRSDGRYCTPACRQKAYRQRQNGGA